MSASPLATIGREDGMELLQRNVSGGKARIEQCLLTRIVGWVTFSVGIVVFAGWTFGIPELAHLLPGMSPMKVNTSLGFVLSGAALLLLQIHGKWAGVLTRVCALVMMSLSLFVLMEILTGWDPGIDEFFFLIGNPESPSVLKPPGRMAAESAFCFLLFASKILLFGIPSLKGWHLQAIRLISSVVFSIMVVNLMGYMGGGFFLLMPWKWLISAPLSVLLFLILSTATFVMSWRLAGLRWRLSPMTTSGVVVTICLIIGITAYSGQSMVRIFQIRASLSSLNEVMTILNNLKMTLAQDKDYVTDYLLTSNAKCLVIHDQMTNKELALLTEIKRRSLIGGSQSDHIRRLEANILAWRGLISMNIDMHKSGRDVSDLQPKLSEQENAQMNEIIRLENEIIAEEQENLSTMNKRELTANQWAMVSLPLWMLLLLVLITSGVLRLNLEADRGGQLTDVLKRNFRRLRLSLEGGEFGEWELDLATHKAICSPTHDRIFGYPEGAPAWSYEIFLLHVHPEDRPRVEKAFLESIATKGGWTFECRIIRADKSEAWIWARGEAEPFHSGESQKMYGLVTDITQRKKATEEVILTEERLRLATSAASIGVWEWHVKNDVILWDDYMFLIYGIPVVHGRRVSFREWRARVHPDDLPDQEEQLRKLIETKGTSRREFRIQRESDRSERVIEAFEMAVPGKGGKTERIIGVNIDITDKVRRINDVNRLNQELLSQTNQLASSVKELDAFSYSVSHDLRSPLRAVDGFSKILEEEYAEKVGEDGLHLISVIRNETLRMGRLIDDLLAFSRLGRQEMVPRLIDMTAMARRVYEEQIILNPGRTIHLDLHVLPEVMGSESLLRQVWENLIGNAIKFTKKQAIAEIEIGSVKDPHGETVYYVKDNGAGFDMRYVDKLFGVFQRLHSTDEFPGSGVGLSIVKRIIDRHGGHVWGEGEVNRGATFSFTIPNQHGSDGKSQTNNKQP